MSAKRDLWFARTMNPSPGTFRGAMEWGAHQFGRELFAANFTQGGFSSIAFASSRKEALRNMLRPKVRFGGKEHIRRLESLYEASGKDPMVLRGLKKAQKAKVSKLGKFGGFAKIGGPLAGAAIFAVPAMMEEGSGVEKTERGLAAIVSGTVGWHAGASAGAVAGAALGGTILPGIGHALGAVVGYLGGGMLGFEATDAGAREAFSVPRRLVERERKRRKMDWGTPNPAFYTRQAATMRQVSLQAMNRGMMTSRSALGQEGLWLHQ